MTRLLLSAGEQQRCTPPAREHVLVRQHVNVLLYELTLRIEDATVWVLDKSRDQNSTTGGWHSPPHKVCNAVMLHSG
jgi:hypothetical protein